MNKSLSPFAILICAAATQLVGCSSEPTCDYATAPYMSAQEMPSLTVPDGLTAPDHSGALVVPPVNEKLTKPVEGKKSRCLDRPPSYYSTSQSPKESDKAKEPDKAK